MKPSPMVLRARVIEDCDPGLSTQAVAAKYRVSEAWVRRLSALTRVVTCLRCGMSVIISVVIDNDDQLRYMR